MQWAHFLKIHQINNRALPEQMMAYKCVLLLLKIYNIKILSIEWPHIFLNKEKNKLKVGNNALANSLTFVNNNILLNWLNLSNNSILN